VRTRDDDVNSSDISAEFMGTPLICQSCLLKFLSVKLETKPRFQDKVISSKGDKKTLRSISQGSSKGLKTQMGVPIFLAKINSMRKNMRKREVLMPSTMIGYTLGKSMNLYQKVSKHKTFENGNSGSA
jgi:hypothetical protein